MDESHAIIAALRQRIGAIEGVKPHGLADRFAIGDARLDARLGGGLLRGRLHELFAAEPDDAASAAGFALMLAMRVGDGPIVWLREERAERRLGQLHGPGLIELGIDPGRIISCLVPDETALLRAAGDVVRCAEVAMLIVEPWKAARALDLTASRRLAVAAEKWGVTTLLSAAKRGANPVGNTRRRLHRAGGGCAGAARHRSQPVAASRGAGGGALSIGMGS
jgi:protein ImuA